MIITPTQATQVGQIENWRSREPSTKKRHESIRFFETIEAVCLPGGYEKTRAQYNSSPAYYEVRSGRGKCPLLLFFYGAAPVVRRCPKTMDEPWAIVFNSPMSPKPLSDLYYMSEIGSEA
ncbi:hypothetical protein JTE90_018690 [Oedothorax gibbosus]|uniref:Uncharacterized protein n=1 Tax=Oedothorax gibbosus TaxID=931172 RepID=A0AAV6V250_9ARAC|nr:hypothetical protein JTE90_018690 [Oedothorax gibbosus]